eukprot:CAMPEP_0117046422 /NCGR_PEP_ID=MMETSP0472-20121206/32103_1 /TAXON_ID=693140 ORGANISM="Tiarina fusus, Strain LIS" /NCGR_SAMPLE_ID=MMETSP0472 /ASSEMBLY_ACC=CAM_ASM_000603 /LENGTH=506 /DNA_ID=CAMNT_0004758777 /DNA_START=14 /DNA_END=1534 /DNA_ORIENTATION=+
MKSTVVLCLLALSAAVFADEFDDLKTIEEEYQTSEVDEIDPHHMQDHEVDVFGDVGDMPPEDMTHAVGDMEHDPDFMEKNFEPVSELDMDDHNALHSMSEAAQEQLNTMRTNEESEAALECEAEIDEMEKLNLKNRKTILKERSVMKLVTEKLQALGEVSQSSAEDLSISELDLDDNSGLVASLLSDLQVSEGRHHEESAEITKLLGSLDKKLAKELYQQRLEILTALNGCRGKCREQTHARKQLLLEARRLRRKARALLQVIYKQYEKAKGKYETEKAQYEEHEARVTKDNKMREKELVLIQSLMDKLKELIDSSEATSDLQIGDSMVSQMSTLLSAAEGLPDLEDVVSMMQRGSSQSKEVGMLLNSVKAKIQKEIKDDNAKLSDAHDNLKATEADMNTKKAKIAPGEEFVEKKRKIVARKQKLVRSSEKHCAKLDEHGLLSNAAGGGEETPAEAKARKAAEKLHQKALADEKERDDKMKAAHAAEHKKAEEQHEKLKNYKKPSE